MDFFLSDTHFNNENIIRYCNRPFANAAEMNETIIKNWNAIVANGDTVHVLGDFILGSPETIPEILNRLNGKIHLVRGNHDTPRKLGIYEQYPEKIIVKDIEYVSFGGLWFVCCHFPITDEGFLDMVTKDNSEVVVLHGHVHDKEPFCDIEHHKFNLSVDVTEFSPVPISNIHAIVRQHFIEKGVWKGK